MQTVNEQDVGKITQALRAMANGSENLAPKIDAQVLMLAASLLEQQQRKIVELSSQLSDFVDNACARIQAADDAAADRDYMLDSKDCIDVLRGTWKGNYKHDQPSLPASAASEEDDGSNDLVPVDIRQMGQLKTTLCVAIAGLFEHYPEDVLRVFDEEDLQEVLLCTQQLLDKRVEDVYALSWALLRDVPALVEDDLDKVQTPKP